MCPDGFWTTPKSYSGGTTSVQALVQERMLDLSHKLNQVCHAEFPERQMLTVLTRLDTWCSQELALTSCARHAVEASIIKVRFPNINPRLMTGIRENLGCPRCNKKIQHHKSTCIYSWYSIHHVLSHFWHNAKLPGWRWGKLGCTRFDSGGEGFADQGTQILKSSNIVLRIVMGGSFGQFESYFVGKFSNISVLLLCPE